MKYSSLFFIFLFFLGGPGFGRSFLELPVGRLTPLTDLNTQWSNQGLDNQVETLLLTLASFDESWNQSQPHLAESYLFFALKKCESIVFEDPEALTHVLFHRLVGVCLIFEAEGSNRTSPWRSFSTAQNIGKLRHLFETTQLPKSEQLYVEGRVFSSLPPLLGQNFKKALVSLEMLRRFESNEQLSLPWINRIRMLQGKMQEKPASESFPEFFRRKETDGLPISLFPLLTGNFPQGIGIQLRGVDSAIFDKKRRIAGRVFVTHRGSLGGEIKYDDDESWKGKSLAGQFQFLHGIQQYHGLGIESATNSIDLYHDRGIIDLAVRYPILLSTYLKFGYRLHLAHLRKVEGGVLDSGLPQISNAFDSGLVAEIGYDSRDSETEPFQGNRLLLQLYLPRNNWLSSSSFERIYFLAEHYRNLSLNINLKMHTALISVSDGAPFFWFSQLSGSIPFNGVRTARYMDRSLAALGGELRWKRWNPVTLLGYGNMGSVAPSVKNVLTEHFKIGAGVGAEIHLTRFRYRAFRIEAGIFGGQFSFNSMLGVPLE